MQTRKRYLKLKKSPRRLIRKAQVKIFHKAFKNGIQELKILSAIHKSFSVTRCRISGLIGCITGAGILGLSDWSLSRKIKERFCFIIPVFFYGIVFPVVGFFSLIFEPVRIFVEILMLII